jgi:hypothetical protein
VNTHGACPRPPLLPAAPAGAPPANAPSRARPRPRGPGRTPQSAPGVRATPSPDFVPAAQGRRQRPVPRASPAPPPPPAPAPRRAAPGPRPRAPRGGRFCSCVVLSLGWPLRPRHPGPPCPSPPCASCHWFSLSAPQPQRAAEARRRGALYCSQTATPIPPSTPRSGPRGIPYAATRPRPRRRTSAASKSPLASERAGEGGAGCGSGGSQAECGQSRALGAGARARGVRARAWARGRAPAIASTPIRVATGGSIAADTRSAAIGAPRLLLPRVLPGRPNARRPYTPAPGAIDSASAFATAPAAQAPAQAPPPARGRAPKRRPAQRAAVAHHQPAAPRNAAQPRRHARRRARRDGPDAGVARRRPGCVPYRRCWTGSPTLPNARPVPSRCPPVLPAQYPTSPPPPPPHSVLPGAARPLPLPLAQPHAAPRPPPRGARPPPHPPRAASLAGAGTDAAPSDTGAPAAPGPRVPRITWDAQKVSGRPPARAAAGLCRAPPPSGCCVRGMRAGPLCQAPAPRPLPRLGPTPLLLPAQAAALMRLARIHNLLPSTLLVLAGAWVRPRGVLGRSSRGRRLAPPSTRLAPPLTAPQPRRAPQAGTGHSLAALASPLVWLMALLSGGIAVSSCVVNDYFDVEVGVEGDPGGAVWLCPFVCAAHTAPPLPHPPLHPTPKHQSPDRPSQRARQAARVGRGHDRRRAAAVAGDLLRRAHRGVLHGGMAGGGASSPFACLGEGLARRL